MNKHDQPAEEPRMDKVEEAKWRIANGYYEMDFVWEEALERLAEALRKEE